MEGKRLLRYRKRALFPLGIVAVAMLAAGLALIFGGGRARRRFTLRPCRISV